MKPIAWTGGTRPAKLSQISKEERKLVSLLFYESMVSVWTYWGDYQGLCPSVLESARVHYRRARYDAHTTMRT